MSSRWESVEITVCVRARQAGGVGTHVRNGDMQSGKDKHTKDAVAQALEGKEN